MNHTEENGEEWTEIPEYGRHREWKWWRDRAVASHGRQVDSQVAMVECDAGMRETHTMAGQQHNHRQVQEPQAWRVVEGMQTFMVWRAMPRAQKRSVVQRFNQEI